jgi:hypothetical protein
MNLIRKTLTLLGTITLLALLLAALAPRAARGVAAALVQITNTSANAVPTVSGPGNFPFTANLCSPGTVTCGALPSSFTVPATTSTGASVRRLVIEQFSGSCFDNDFAVLFVQAPSDHFGVSTGDTFFFPTGAGSPFFNASTHIYADAGTLVGASSGEICSNVTLLGHLETQ